MTGKLSALLERSVLLGFEHEDRAAFASRQQLASRRRENALLYAAEQLELVDRLKRRSLYGIEDNDFAVAAGNQQVSGRRKSQRFDADAGAARPCHRGTGLRQVGRHAWSTGKARRTKTGRDARRNFRDRARALRNRNN